MASEELVTEQFSYLGIEIEKPVLEKCLSLCKDYEIDAETLTEQWMAFNLTHLNGAAAPTIENLELLARKEISKRVANRLAPSKETALPSAGAKLKVYGSHVPANESDIDVLSNYMGPNVKRVKVELEPAPVYQNELCPATYSPKTAHSAKYASRTNQGTVVHSFGDEKLLDIMSKASVPHDLFDVDVTQVPNDDGDVYSKSMFGFELLHEKASTFDNHIQYISQCIMKKAGITETTSVRNKSQSEVYVSGRIECDADARLHAKCAVLQGTWADSLSQAVPLDLDNVQQYSLFPGQVVVVRGSNPRGDRLLASEVFTDAARRPPSSDIINTFRGTISLVVASGPYTTSDNLAYEPLKDLISYINFHRPHVVVMTGPFLDSEHAKVMDNTMAETFKAFFDKLIDSLGDLSTTSPNTKFYIVSSLKDAFHVNIYPCPPYSARRKHPNVHMMPDPCTLDVGGTLVGVTSTDVLMHISQEEVSLGTGGDKLARVSGHIVSQQCYYPLCPAAVPADSALWAAHAQLTHTPHVLVLPSHFRYFVKDVNGCVVVNPEHLTKGTGGGTFARLLLSTDDAGVKNIAAQIVRI